MKTRDKIDQNDPTNCQRIGSSLQSGHVTCQKL